MAFFMMASSKSSKSPPPGITLREVKADDIKSMMRLLKEEEPSWPRIDWYVRSLIEEYPGCFQIAENTEKEICGLIGGIPITDTEGYFTHLLVKKDHRGRGIGRLLLDSTLNFMGERNILLAATSDGFPMYQRRGFQIGGGTFHVLRGQIVKECIEKIQDPVDGLDIRNVEEINADALINYNESIHGIKEEWFFRRHLCQGREVVGKAAIQNTKLVGFSYLVMSPASVPQLTLYANTLPVAKILLKSLFGMSNSRNTEPWDFVVPSGNKNAMDMFCQFQSDKSNGFEVTPMYSKCPVSVSFDHIYSTHTSAYHFC